MSSKVIMFLGAVLSALLVYLCVSTKKEEIAAALNPEKTHTVQMPAVSVAKQPVERKQPAVKAASSPATAAAIKKTSPKKAPQTAKTIPPSFAYISGKKLQITAMISEKEKEGPLFSHIKSFCASHPCEERIEIEKGRGEAKWQPEALQIISLFEEAHIPQSALTIQDNNVMIDGLFTDKQSYAKLAELVASLKAKGYRIDDRSYLQETVKEAPKEVEKGVEKANATEAKIAEILVEEPIMFRFNSAQLSGKSKKTLDKIARMLDKESGVSIEIAGYTDAKGRASYNLTLSQKRAESVRKYLLSRMKSKKEIVAKGYGASDFITENPNDKRNRRVEIYLLKKGA